MNPRDKKIFGTPEVLEKFGVPPKTLCDLQALTGDVAVSENVRELEREREGGREREREREREGGRGSERGEGGGSE